LFTLRTHAAIIWSTELDEKRTADLAVSQSQAIHESPEALTRQATGGTVGPVKTDIRDSPLYQRILGQSLKQTTTQGVPDRSLGRTTADGMQSAKSPHIVPPRTKDNEVSGFRLERLSEAENLALTRQMAEIAATAAVVATRDARGFNRKTSQVSQAGKKPTTQVGERPAPNRIATAANIEAALHPDAGGVEAGGHDAPNWSKTKSAVILLVATIAYAIIAEILVNTVDAVLDNFAIDQKFLGITLFALVPNTTEFLVGVPR
jgi:Ca2+:H+ antiporter